MGPAWPSAQSRKSRGQEERCFHALYCRRCSRCRFASCDPFRIADEIILDAFALSQAVPHALIERSPGADLGTPGPLVHELEKIPGYQDLLIESLQRQPQELTVWMVNRILNAEVPGTTREKWLSILTAARNNANASENTKDEVRFISSIRQLACWKTNTQHAPQVERYPGYAKIGSPISPEQRFP